VLWAGLGGRSLPAASHERAADALHTDGRETLIRHVCICVFVCVARRFRPAAFVFPTDAVAAGSDGKAESAREKDEGEDEEEDDADPALFVNANRRPAMESDTSEPESDADSSTGEPGET
jgi:hypothetical protein